MTAPTTATTEARQQLSDNLKYGYERGAYPGSADWNANQALETALAEFDLAHPEIKAAIEAAKASKADLSWDAMNTI